MLFHVVLNEIKFYSKLFSFFRHYVNTMTIPSVSKMCFCSDLNATELPCYKFVDHSLIEYRYFVQMCPYILFIHILDGWPFSHFHIDVKTLKYDMLVRKWVVTLSLGTCNIVIIWIYSSPPLIRPFPPRASLLIRPFPPRASLLIRPLPPRASLLIRPDCRWTVKAI